MTTYAHITGCGHYLPRTILTNDDLATIVDTSDAWITEHTGIRERRIALVGETVATMSADAGRQALERAGHTPEDLDLIICSTSSPDRQLPGASPIVQSLLGAKGAAAFDLRSGCSGFIYGLAVARGLIESGAYRCILVLGAEVVTRNLNWSDRRTCVLFGDGAGAAIVEAREQPGGILYTAIGTQGDQWSALTVRSGGSEHPMCAATIQKHWNTVELDGRQTATFAVRTLLRRAGQAVAGAGLTWDDVDLFIPHQANLRLIELASNKLGVPMERMFVNVDRYANMSTASVPVALSEAAAQGRIREGDHVLLVAFGAGLSWGAAVLQWGGGAAPRGRRGLTSLRSRTTDFGLSARLALAEAVGRLRRH